MNLIMVKVFDAINRLGTSDINRLLESTPGGYHPCGRIRSPGLGARLVGAGPEQAIGVPEQISSRDKRRLSWNI